MKNSLSLCKRLSLPKVKFLGTTGHPYLCKDVALPLLPFAFRLTIVAPGFRNRGWVKWHASSSHSQNSDLKVFPSFLINHSYKHKTLYANTIRCCYLTAPV